MAKHLVKYKLHGSETPWYIEEAGVFTLPDSLVGVTKDDATCYIPSDIQKLSKQDLKTLFSTIEMNGPPMSGRKLTKQEKDEYIDRALLGKI